MQRVPEHPAREAPGARILPWLLVLIAAVGVAACARGPSEPEGSATPLRARLLTGEQYTNTIAHVFGQDVAASISAPLPPLTRTDGLLASGAASVGVTSDQIQQIQQVAQAVGATVVDESHRAFLVPCRPVAADEPDPACAAAFLRAAGRLLYRRPVEESRVAELVEIAGRAAGEAGDFYAGLALGLEAILISPDVLFVIDRAEPDPDRPGEERLTGYSLASRLSFFLWNGPPDDELLNAAANGELHTRAGLEREVERMLASSRLEDGMRAFFDDMLAFDAFDSLAKDPNVYPMVTGATLADAREQTLRTIVDHLLHKERDYRDLFTTRETFMSMHLAAVYGVPTANGWVPYEFAPDSDRQGLLTHISFLAANSHSVRSSPTKRGKALRELFLCQKVPDPPPNVDFSALEEAGDVATARERLKVHNTNPSCAGCHLITDPMGLSLENFDGAGRYRATENGAEIDISGELDGMFYDDIGGLAQAMRNHPKLPNCLVSRLFAYGTGGPVELRYDRDMLTYFTGRFEEEGFRLPALLKDLAMSGAFVRIRPTEQTDEKQAGVVAKTRRDVSGEEHSR